MDFSKPFIGSDICFVFLDGKKLYAHKLIIFLSSKVLTDIINENKTEIIDNHNVIEINDDFDGFSMLLKFIYPNDDTKEYMLSNNFKELLKLSYKYDIPRLIKKFKSDINNEINRNYSDNIEYVKLIELYENKNPQQWNISILDQIYKHLSSTEFKKDELRSFSYDTLSDVLKYNYGKTNKMFPKYSTGERVKYKVDTMSYFRDGEIVKVLSDDKYDIIDIFGEIFNGVHSINILSVKKS